MDELILTATQLTAFQGLEVLIEQVFTFGVVDGSNAVLLPPMAGYNKLKQEDKDAVKASIKQVLVPLLVTLLP